LTALQRKNAKIKQLLGEDLKGETDRNIWNEGYEEYFPMRFCGSDCDQARFPSRIYRRESPRPR
jgi:hypothetical protein